MELLRAPSASAWAWFQVKEFWYFKECFCPWAVTNTLRSWLLQTTDRHITARAPPYAGIYAFESETKTSFHPTLSPMLFDVIRENHQYHFKIKLRGSIEKSLIDEPLIGHHMWSWHGGQTAVKWSAKVWCQLSTSHVTLCYQLIPSYLHLHQVPPLYYTL